MGLFNKNRRRRVLSTGLSSLAAAATVIPEANAALKPKAPGETRIVAVMGDYWHNGAAQEIHVRRVFSSKKEWRIIFVRASRFFTPELLSDTDLLITARYGGRDSIGWSTEGLVDTLERGDLLWTDENVKAIIDNVMNRGMGYMALHCTLFSEIRDILDLMDQNLVHDKILL